MFLDKFNKLTILQLSACNILFLQSRVSVLLHNNRITVALLRKNSKPLLEYVKRTSTQQVFYNYYDVYKFTFYKFTAFFGLGYKKKIYSKTSFQNKFYFFIGDRHWAVLQVPPGSYIFNVKKRNLIFFANSKASIYRLISVIKSFKKLIIHFKTKGFFLTRINRRWLLVRRLKLRGFVPKLSTKQKFI